MAKSNASFTGQFTDIVRKLSLQQKIGIAVAAVASIVAVVMLITWANKPTYGVLFSNLEAKDASQIVAKLKAASVPYQLGDEGKSILVPKDKVYSLRLQMAGQGLPKSSIVGYGIFDKPSFGMTDFTQRVDYKRALEGELEKTILQLDEVRGASVHIVIPEKALFTSQQKKTTASVFLKLKDGDHLNPREINGIQNLVAASIEGLDPDNVTIVDARGDMLSRKSTGVDALTSTQYDLQTKVENYLANKAQTMLDAVLGPGNAIVRVSADLDFSQVEKTTEQYDPNSVVLSQQTMQQHSTVPGDTANNNSGQMNTVTNYDVGKTVEKLIGGVGGIKKLSVAVLVNGKYTAITKGGVQSVEYTPRSQQEVSQLTNIVKTAVGFDPTRGDQVSLVNIPFENGNQQFMMKPKPGFHIQDYADKIVILAAMIGAVLVFLSIFRRMRKGEEEVSKPVMVSTRSKQPLPDGGKGAQEPVDEIESMQAAEYSEEILRAQKIRETVGDYIQTKPVDAAKLLKVWLTDDGE